MAEGTAYLIPAFPTDEEQQQYIRARYLEFCEEELAAWYVDESLWPVARTWERFEAWLDRQVTPMVFDAAADFFPVLPAPDSPSTSDEGEPVINWPAVEECALALMYLTLHDEVRVWKGHDWEVLDRLHVKGFISSPKGGAKSVTLTAKGLHAAGAAFQRLFTVR